MFFLVFRDDHQVAGRLYIDDYRTRTYEDSAQAWTRKATLDFWAIPDAKLETKT